MAVWNAFASKNLTSSQNPKKEVLNCVFFNLDLRP